MTKIKICGLRTPKDIQYANELLPDYVGFVFQKGRRRYVSPSQAAALRRFLDPRIPAVGVFVDEPVENMVSLLKSGTIQIVQLHGNEDTAYCERLKNLFPCPVIKAFIIREQGDIEKALDFPSDYLLLDGGLGAGKAFDWSLIRNIDRPFFLAGGLNCENVADALALCHPYAVDVSSAVEASGAGISGTMAPCTESFGNEAGSCKDYDKMRTFIQTVRTHTKNK